VLLRPLGELTVLYLYASAACMYLLVPLGALYEPRSLPALLNPLSLLTDRVRCSPPDCFRTEVGVAGVGGRVRRDPLDGDLVTGVEGSGSSSRLRDLVNFGIFLKRLARRFLVAGERLGPGAFSSLTPPASRGLVGVEVDGAGRVGSSSSVEMVELQSEATVRLDSGRPSCSCVVSEGCWLLTLPWLDL